MSRATSASSRRQQGEGSLDAQLNLLDRQLIDSHGRLVAKIDDVELHEVQGDLVVSGFLTGPGALGPRIGGAPGAITTAAWARLAGRDPEDPKRIDAAHVTKIATAIHLDVPRERLRVTGFEVWARERIVTALPGCGDDPDLAPSGDIDPEADVDPGRDDAPTPRHRLDRLLGSGVRFADGRDGEQVIDATLARVSAHPRAALRVEGLVIGRRRPGTLFGYHRHPRQGPWLIRVIVHAMHRTTSYVDWADVDRIDWDARVVHLNVDECRPLATR